MMLNADAKILNPTVLALKFQLVRVEIIPNSLADETWPLIAPCQFEETRVHAIAFSDLCWFCLVT